ncbi:MAG: type II toxin-antitoxin system RelE/ParE family toxin [Blautia faecis]
MFEYIAFGIAIPENASGQLDRLEEQILSLILCQNGIENMKMNHGKVVDCVLPVDNYVIFYIPDSNKKVVTILRVMYAGRDIENQLKFHTKQSETITSFSANMETP